MSASQQANVKFLCEVCRSAQTISFFGEVPSGSIVFCPSCRTSLGTVCEVRARVAPVEQGLQAQMRAADIDVSASITGLAHESTHSRLSDN